MGVTSSFHVKYYAKCLSAILAITAIHGCGTITGSGTTSGPGTWIDNSSSAANVDPDTSTVVTGPFGKTLNITLADQQKLVISGTIVSPDQVDTYEVGELLAGDELKVEVVAGDKGFDPALGIFDENQDCMFVNDDRQYYNRQTNPYAYFIVRADTSQCYVVVSASVRSDTVGKYQLQITRTPGTPAANPSSQLVYVNFEGADNVVIGRRDPVDVPPFSGDMIDAQFSGDTEELIDLVIERMRENYSLLNVEIICSRDQAKPSQPHTTLHLGSYNPALLGIADSIDSFNADSTQQAVIFVDTFSAFMSQEPTLQEIAYAIANVASHELGHLLGLHHTADSSGIMDTTASLRQMLLPQTFNRSPLNSGDTFLVGHQNALRTLLQNVGGDEAAIFAVQKSLKLRSHDPWYDQGPEGPAREHIRFGTACTGH